MIQIDAEALQGVIGELSRDVNAMCCEASMFIGKLRSGKVVQITVMDADEAENQGFDGDHAGIVTN